MSAFTDVKARIEGNVDGFEDRAASIPAALPLSIAWIDFETGHAADIPAADLLKGARLALLEAASAWAIGLNRGAAGSLRTFIENTFAWLYYKDHPIEFNLVTKKEIDLLLPKSIQKYLKEIDSGFDKAYSIIVKVQTRPDEYYYTNLSFFSHAHPSQLLSGKPSHELVVTAPPDAGFLAVCANVDEFISDNFATAYRNSWGLVPQIVKDSVSERLAAKSADFLAIA